MKRENNIARNSQEETLPSKEENYFIRQDRIRREQEEQRRRELTQFVQDDFAKMQSEGKNIVKRLPSDDHI